MSKSRGSNLLSRLGRTGEVLSATLGVDRSTAERWMAGTRTPGTSRRRVIEATYAIPCPSWDEPIEVVALRAAPSRAADEPRLSAADNADPIKGTIAQMRRIAQKRDEHLASGNMKLYLKCEQEEVILRKNLARYTGATLAITEAVALRSPQFAQLFGVICTALEGHPDALAAVQAVVDEARGRP